MEAIRGKAAVFADKGRSSRSDGGTTSQPAENEPSGFDYLNDVDCVDFRSLYGRVRLPNAPVDGRVQRSPTFDIVACTDDATVGYVDEIFFRTFAL